MASPESVTCAQYEAALICEVNGSPVVTQPILVFFPSVVASICTEAGDTDSH